MRRTLPFLLLLTACSTPQAPVDPVPVATIELRDDLRPVYDSLQVTGSFILHDGARDHWLYVDSTQADVATLPASTFKIFSSLYGLESGVVQDADFVIPWDSVDYGRPEVNRDLSLRDAYDVSAYWYHREVARRAGPGVLKHWLDTVGYGNADTSGGYDRAWVAGGLRITPRQQIGFLERLQRNELPLSLRTMTIVKGIMIRAEDRGYVLRAKTGWAMGDAGSIGWYVGWVETPDSTGPFFFANRIFTPDTLSTTFAEARKTIAMDILQRAGAWPR
jgi:beta-lactamase class D